MSNSILLSQPVQNLGSRTICLPGMWPEMLMLSASSRSPKAAITGLRALAVGRCACAAGAEAAMCLLFRACFGSAVCMARCPPAAAVFACTSWPGLLVAIAAAAAAAAVMGLLVSKLLAKTSGLEGGMKKICLTGQLTAGTALLIWLGGLCNFLMWELLCRGTADLD